MGASLIRILLLLAVSATMPVRAQTRLGESCDLAVLGATDTAVFLRFDRALREAFEQQDATALAPLVSFPLRLNRADGSHVVLANATALQAQYPQVLAPALRAVLARQRPETLFCNADGMMYGAGELWVNRVEAGTSPQWRITAVNLPAAVAQAPQGKTLLACSTDKVQVVIDGPDDGTPRYRAWNKPHPASGPPALELEGRTEVEGRGACARRIWRFRNDKVDYVLSEPGCGPDTPQGARAMLEVLIDGRARLHAWCF